MSLDLHDTIRFGFIDQAISLVQCKQNGSARAQVKSEPSGCSALHVACMQRRDVSEKHVQLVSLLMDRHPYGFLDRDSDGNLPIHHAVNLHFDVTKYSYSYDIVKTLIQYNPDCLCIKGKDNQLPLHIVARNGNASLVKLLINKNPAALQVCDDHGEYPLHAALKNGRVGFKSSDIIAMMLKKYPEVASMPDKRDNLPIHIACSSGNKLWLDFVKQLAKTQPDSLMKKNNAGNLPIHLAAKWCDVSTLKDLVKLCPKSVEVKDDDGNLALHTALRCHESSYSSSSFSDFLKYCVDTYPGILTQEDKNGNLPIHIAATRARNETLEYLLSKYEGGLLHMNNDGHLPIDLSGDDGGFETLALACPESLIRPGKVPFQPLLNFLRKHNLAQHRVKRLEKIFQECTKFIKLDSRTEKTFQQQQMQHRQSSNTDAIRELEQKLKEVQDSHKIEIRKQESILKMVKSEHKAEIKKLESDHQEALSADTKCTTDQLAKSFNVYRELVSKGRKADKDLLANLMNRSSSSVFSISSLKSFAVSLKNQIDVYKAHCQPKGKRSSLQIHFQSIISNPNLPREELIETIESLDAELVELESELERMTAAPGSVTVVGTTTNTAIDEDSTVRTGRPSKRARVSLP